MKINRNVLDHHAAVLDRAMRDPRLSHLDRLVLLATTELADPATGEIACSIGDIVAKMDELANRAFNA